MATGNLYKKQMGDFLTPATDTVPTLSPYDVNTPQAAREGLPLRMFDPTRARYKEQYGAMEATVNSFKKTGEYLDSYMEAQNSD